MNSEVFEALNLLEKERGIPVDFMLDKIKKDVYKRQKQTTLSAERKIFPKSM